MRSCFVDVELSKSDLVERPGQTKSARRRFIPPAMPTQPVHACVRARGDSANLEAGQPFRLLGHDVDPVDARAARALAANATSRVDRVALALEDRLDRARRAGCRTQPATPAASARRGVVSRKKTPWT